MHLYLVRRNLALLAAACFLLLTGAAQAADGSCKQLFKLKSVNSGSPTTITFVNASNAQRGLLWLGYDGHPKDYGNLAPGQSRTQKTFVGHPWMITNGPGDCIEIVMPTQGGSVVRLTATSNEPKPKQANTNSGSSAGGQGTRPTWCERAQSITEQTICGNPAMWRMTETLKVAYGRALNDSPRKRAEIEKETQRWRSRRNGCEADVQCIDRRYSEHLSILESYFNN